MEHPIIQIKNAITALLKGIDPDTDVFYEEIKGTEEKHGLDEPETYYFVDIIPKTAAHVLQCSLTSMHNRNIFLPPQAGVDTPA